MDVTILGAGVSGLTCGVRLLEEGCDVTIAARDLPRDTTSAVAGAVWFPYRVSPNERTGAFFQSGYWPCSACRKATSLGQRGQSSGGSSKRDAATYG